MSRRLLARWKMRAASYYEQMQQEYEDSPDRNKTIMAMHYQLVKCINELESELGDDSTTRLLEAIVFTEGLKE